MKKRQCQCFKPPFNYNDFKSTSIGIDKTNGRFGEVTIETCIKCSHLWLHYFYEIEAFEHSGKWYRGSINTEQLSKIKPENAVLYLKSLDWHFFGGSYFGIDGMKSTSNINL